MNKITLINPKSGWFKGKYLPTNLSLGLLAIATELDKRGYGVQVIDELDVDFKERFNASFSDTAIYIISVDIQSVKKSLELSEHIKRRNGRAKIVWGSFWRGFFGKFVNMYPELALEPQSVDFIALSDVDLINFISSDLSNTNGIGYKQNSEKVVNYDISSECLMDINYDLVDIEKNYINRVGLEVCTDKKSKRILPVFTGEGCPFKCTFCINSAPYIKNKFVLKEADKVINEIKYLKSRYNVSHIWFQDDNLFADKERIFKLFDYMAKQDIQWAGQGRVEYFNNSYLSDEYFLSIVKNCCWFGVGYETYSDRLRRAFNKGSVTTEKLLHVFNLCKRANIVIAIAFIVGMVDETTDEILQDAQFILKLKDEYQKTSVTYQPFRPYPGTGEYQKISEKYTPYQPSSIYEYIESSPFQNMKFHYWLTEKQKGLIRYLHKVVLVANAKDSLNCFLRIIANAFYLIARYRIRNNDFRFFVERYIV